MTKTKTSSIGGGSGAFLSKSEVLCGVAIMVAALHAMIERMTFNATMKIGVGSTIYMRRIYVIWKREEQ